MCHLKPSLPLLYNCSILHLFLCIYIVLAVAKQPVIDGLMAISNNDNGRFVANAHTLIKVFQVIVLFPFLKPIVKLSCACVRGEDKKVGYRAAGQLIGRIL